MRQLKGKLFLKEVTCLVPQFLSRQKETLICQNTNSIDIHGIPDSHVTAAGIDAEGYVDVAVVIGPSAIESLQQQQHKMTAAQCGMTRLARITSHTTGQKHIKRNLSSQVVFSWYTWRNKIL